MFRQGMTLRQVAEQFDVHINSVDYWRQCRMRVGLVGLYQGYHSYWQPKLSPSSSVSCADWPMMKRLLEFPAAVQAPAGAAVAEPGDTGTLPEADRVALEALSAKPEGQTG